MEKTAKLTSWDILFWILMILIIALAVWKLVGSPSDTAALIAVALFVVGSEILLWRALFSMDKKVSCGFMKIKYEMNDMKKEINNKFNHLSSKLDNIDNLIRRKK